MALKHHQRSTWRLPKTSVLSHSLDAYASAAASSPSPRSATIDQTAIALIQVGDAAWPTTITALTERGQIADVQTESAVASDFRKHRGAPKTTTQAVTANGAIEAVMTRKQAGLMHHNDHTHQPNPAE